MTLFPHTPDFFTKFETLAHIASQAAGYLSKVDFADPNRMKIAKAVQKLELEADEITHIIAHDADSTFITPIDREDIHALADHLDNLLDLIENVTTGLTLYRIKGNGKEFKQYTTLILDAVKVLEKLVGQLRGRGKAIESMREKIEIVHAKEKEGDILTRKTISMLFTTKKNAVDIIKWKYIYDNLEMILDECELIADAIDETIIKNF